MDSDSNNLLNRYGKFILRHRWWVIMASVFVCLAVAAGAKNLTFNNDHRIYFSADNPQNIAYEKLQKQFSQDNAFMLAIDFGEKSLFQPESLTYLYELTAASWEIPFSSRVDSLANFMDSKSIEGALEVKELIADPAELNLERIAAIKKTALTDPMIVDRLFSEDQSTAVIVISLQYEKDDVVGLENAVSSTRAMIAKFEKQYPGSKIHLAGTSMTGIAFIEAAKHDMQTMVPLMYLVILLAIFLIFRSFFGVVLSVLIIVLSTAGALGLTGWLGWGLNATSSNAPTIIITLAVADTVHFLVGVFQEMAKGTDRHEAILRSIQSNFNPIFFTSITTAIGFFSMNFMDIQPFREFGNITGFGVLIAFVLVMTLAPALIAVVPLRVSAKKKETKNHLNKLAEFVIQHRLKLLLGSALLTILLGVSTKNLVIDDAFQRYFSRVMPYRIAVDYVDETVGGANSIEYSLDAGVSGGIKNPEYLKKLDEFVEYVRALPEVTHVSSVVDVFKKLNKNMHDDDAAYYRLPETRELAAQYLLLFELSLPFGKDLTNQINIDKSSSRVTISTRALSTKNNVELTEKLDHWLEMNGPQSMHTSGTGIGVIFSHLYNENMEGMIKGTLVAFVLITLCMFFSLRSGFLGLVSMIPNAVPIILAYGAWYYINGTVGLATATVAMASIGIVVDDTVHFLTKYMRHRKTKSPEESILNTFGSVGSSLWITSAVLAAGFGVLSLSVFKLNADMGALIALTIICALAADFLILPALLLVIDRPERKGAK